MNLPSPVPPILVRSLGRVMPIEEAFDDDDARVVRDALEAYAESLERDLGADEARRRHPDTFGLLERFAARLGDT